MVSLHIGAAKFGMIAGRPRRHLTEKLIHSHGCPKVISGDVLPDATAILFGFGRLNGFHDERAAPACVDDLPASTLRLRKVSYSRAWL